MSKPDPIRDEIESRLIAAGDALKAFPRSPNGLPLESVRITQKYQTAKRLCESIFSELRNHNTQKRRIAV